MSYPNTRFPLPLLQPGHGDMVIAIKVLLTNLTLEQFEKFFAANPDSPHLRNSVVSIRECDANLFAVQQNIHQLERMIGELQIQKGRLCSAVNRCVDVLVTIDREHPLQLLPRLPDFIIPPNLRDDTPVQPPLYAPVPVHTPLYDIAASAAPPLPIPDPALVVESAESPSPISSLSSVTNSSHASLPLLPRASRSTTRRPASSTNPAPRSNPRRTGRTRRSNASSSNLTTEPPRLPSHSPSPPRRRRRVRSPLVEDEDAGIDADNYDDVADSNMTGEP
ncbi:hypothetical protein EUX98_g8664 [Antrodiella citrinella]|uniref:Uncharacterized protein n=1 Tax=Antrodiella citrinella TaxID=2447956 RepID=A0A4S4M5W4_9APHY|nr:hypothetical protein EUX98_g8664 [Antrodiella citrinella]